MNPAYNEIVNYRWTPALHRLVSMNMISPTESAQIDANRAVVCEHIYRVAVQRHGAGSSISPDALDQLIAEVIVSSVTKSFRQAQAAYPMAPPMAHPQNQYGGMNTFMSQMNPYKPITHAPTSINQSSPYATRNDPSVAMNLNDPNPVRETTHRTKSTPIEPKFEYPKNHEPETFETATGSYSAIWYGPETGDPYGVIRGSLKKIVPAPMLTGEDDVLHMLAADDELMGRCKDIGVIARVKYRVPEVLLIDPPSLRKVLEKTLSEENLTPSQRMTAKVRFGELASFMQRLKNADEKIAATIGDMITRLFNEVSRAGMCTLNNPLFTIEFSDIDDLLSTFSNRPSADLEWLVTDPRYVHYHERFVKWVLAALQAWVNGPHLTTEERCAALRNLTVRGFEQTFMIGEASQFEKTANYPDIQKKIEQLVAERSLIPFDHTVVYTNMYVPQNLIFGGEPPRVIVCTIDNAFEHVISENFGPSSSLLVTDKGNEWVRYMIGTTPDAHPIIIK